MPCLPTTRIGEGGPAIVLEETQNKWPAIEVSFHRDDISRPTDWRIHKRRHAVVVHLGGHMQRLETELEGFGAAAARLFRLTRSAQAARSPD
jgi:hypothetical protein